MSERGGDTTLRIEWGGEALVLCADRAVFHEPSGTLFVADVHLGKPEHFRAAGRPVPEDVTGHDLARLSRLIEGTGASRLVVLGDLLHAELAAGSGTTEAFASWRRGHGHVEIVLVRGNHDRRAARSAGALGIEAVDGPWEAGPFSCVHEPDRAIDGRPSLAGHVHPAVRLGRRFTPGVRASCFWFTPAVCVLPAFGRFTGTKVIRPGAADRVVAVGDGALVDVTPRSAASR